MPRWRPSATILRTGDWASLLAGQTARRAHTTLFLIESKSGYLASRAKQALERGLSDETARERDIEFLEAFALEREPPNRPTIQDIERYAARWAPFVPGNARVRATVAHLLGRKYQFAENAVPATRAALHLDDDAVTSAYRQMYRQPLASIYTPASLGERVRWLWHRLDLWIDRLPPAWSAYALSLTETVGTSILALPIAFAAVGPLGGVVVLFVLGLVNVVTAAAMGEAVARSGAIRYGTAYVGTMVEDYLGRAGAVVLSATTFVFTFLLLGAYGVGLSTTLAGATQIPALGWMAALFAVTILMLGRRSLNATVGIALVVGVVNITVILVLCGLALRGIQTDNAIRIDLPLVGGRPLDPATFGAVVGVVLTAYFGHLSVTFCGRAVLQREPTGRALVRGVVAAQLTALALYSLWTLAVGGALNPAVLAGESGTVLVPLARAIGPSVRVLGCIYAVLGLGMGAIHYSFALFNLVRERLPASTDPVVPLPRRKGRLVVSTRSRRPLEIALSYLGTDGGSRFRIDVRGKDLVSHLEGVADDHSRLLGPESSSPLAIALTALPHDIPPLKIDIVDAGPTFARVRITTRMVLRYEGSWESLGASLSNLLELPEAESDLLGWMFREDVVSLDQIVTRTGQGEEASRRMVESLVARGLITELTTPGAPQFRARMGNRRSGGLPSAIWSAFADDAGPAEPSVNPNRATPGPLRQARLRGGTARYVAGIAPVAASFALSSWMLVTGSGSFAGMVSFAGVVVVAVLAGVFPVLLLVSSRRRGGCPTQACGRVRSNAVVLASIYLLSLSTVVLHGLVIWKDVLRRAGALAAAAGIILVTLAVQRGRGFRRRVVLEVRGEEAPDGSERGYFSVTASGEPTESDVELAYGDSARIVHASSDEIDDFASLREASFRPNIPGDRPQPQELKVWVHRVTPEGNSVALPVRTTHRSGDEVVHLGLSPSRGQAEVPLPGSVGEVRVALVKPSRFAGIGGSPIDE